ncbi:MAG: hypothetical protein ACUVSQ_04980 [Pseudanabaenaceae cyanobacterium]
MEKLVVRLGLSCVLLVTLPMAADAMINTFQAPPIFGGVVAIASCFGACFPVLSLFQNREE